MYLVSIGPAEYEDAKECLFLAARSGPCGIMTQMVEAGWDVNSNVLSPDGAYPLLHEAARYGNAAACQELLDLG